MFTTSSTALLLRMAVTAALLAALTQAVAASGKHTVAAKNANTPCTALTKEIGLLDSKMRAGYSGKAGEQIRDRHREAVAEFSRMRCRRL